MVSEEQRTLWEDEKPRERRQRRRSAMQERRTRECSPAPRRVGEWCRVCGARWRERSGGEGERRSVRTGWAGSTTRRAATGESTHAVRRECGRARPPPVRGALSEARRRALPSRPCPTGLPLGGGKVQVKETRSKQPNSTSKRVNDESAERSVLLFNHDVVELTLSALLPIFFPSCQSHCCPTLLSRVTRKVALRKRPLWLREIVLPRGSDTPPR